MTERIKINTKSWDEQVMQTHITHPSFWQAFKFWFKLGFISFGGPAGQISIMHHELVEQKKWVSNERFLNALNYCMLLPGPEAQQLATYIGWLLHRLPGGIVAGAFFVMSTNHVVGSAPPNARTFAGLFPVHFHPVRPELYLCRLWYGFLGGIHFQWSEGCHHGDCGVGGDQDRQKSP